MATSPHDPIPFIDIPARELFPTLKALSEAGFTTEHARLLRSSPAIAQQAFGAVDAHVPKGPEALYRLRFTALVGACRFSLVSVRAENYPASVFGEVGEGHMIDRPEKYGSQLYGQWTDADVAEWLAEKAKKGLEPATLADGLDFAARNRGSQLGLPVVFWGSRGLDGTVPYFDNDTSGGRRLVNVTTPIPGIHHSFLLRKIKKAA